VSGEAKYTDDLPPPSQLLHAALVMSTRAHAKLLSVDPTPALQVNPFLFINMVETMVPPSSLTVFLEGEDGQTYFGHVRLI
jgi:xanthine dehydrogenase molybdopterin-binding subunit B